MSEAADVYQDHVLPHFDRRQHRGRLEDRTHHARVDNPACGDSVEIQLRVNSAGIVETARFLAAGCVITQAAASMITEFCEGRPVEQLRRFTAGEMLSLFRAPLTSQRRQCCLLAWQALQAALSGPSAERSKLNGFVPASGDK